MPSLFLFEINQVSYLALMLKRNLLLNLHEFAHDLGVKFAKITSELSEMLNDPPKDALESICIELKLKHCFNIEWALELTNELGFSNLLLLFAAIHFKINNLIIETELSLKYKLNLSLKTLTHILARLIN